MLVCNVSQRARRASITADLAESATATDATATGNIVFATLVDDPASVADHVDAYLGEIMLEAASASSSVNAGLVYTVTVQEEAHAAETVSGSVPTIWSAAVDETAAAADTVSASVIGVVIGNVAETATATDTPDATRVSAPWKSAMLPTAFVNSNVARQANVNGIMVNL